MKEWAHANDSWRISGREPNGIKGMDGHGLIMACHVIGLGLELSQMAHIMGLGPKRSKVPKEGAGPNEI